MRFDRLIFIAVLVAAIMLTMGCTSSGTPPSPQAMDAANVTVDRMLQAVNDNNYTAFTQNFSATMKSVVDEKRFGEIKTSLDGNYGKYQSRAPAPTTTASGGYNVFLYDCQFEKNKATIQLTMNQSNVWTVEGFFYR